MPGPPICGIRRQSREDYQDPIIFLRYGQMLLVNEEYDEAEEEFKKYKELVPDDPRGDIGFESCQAAIVWTENPTGYIVENMKVFNSRERDFSPAYVNEILFRGLFYLDHVMNHLVMKPMVQQGRVLLICSPQPWTGKGNGVFPFRWRVLNSEFEDGTPCISSDFSRIYFTRCKKGKNQQLGCQIFKSKSDGEGWQEADVVFESLGDSISTAHPAISPDDNTLYFVSDMPGGLGENDIWKVTDGGWTVG